MGLVAIRKQNISMEPIPEQSYLCDPRREFCALFKKGDDHFDVQMLQEPCGDDLLCNPDFEYSEELVLNGDFLGSATGWTLGAGWTYGTNNVSHTGGISAMTQTIATTLITGQRYFLSVLVAGLTGGGSVAFQLGGGAPSAPQTTNGLLLIELTAGGFNNDLLIGSASTVTIDDVSLVTIACWHAGLGFTFDTGAARHTPGTSDDLDETIYTGLASGNLIYVKYAITGMSAGTVYVYVDTVLSRTVTQNGTYEDFVLLIGGDATLKFSADSDFDGCITPQQSYKLFSVADLSGNAFLLDINGNLIDSVDVTLNEDRVNLTYGTSSLDEGCYRIGIIDPCGTLSNEDEISQDVPFDNSAVWSLIAVFPGDTIAMTGGELITTRDVANIDSQYTATQNYTFPNGSTLYAYSVTVITGSMTTGGITIAIKLPSSNGSALATAIAVSSNAFANTTYTVNGYISVSNGTSGTFHNKWQLFIDDQVAGNNEVHLLSASVKLASIEDASGNTFLSNCLSVKEDVGDAMLVQGVSDNAHSLGFVFDQNFPYLSLRAMTHFKTPHLPTANGSYLYSSGRKKKTWAQVDKLWNLVYDSLDGSGLDENTHDSLATIMSADHFYIGSGLTNKREYICVEKDIQPNWDKNSGSSLAELEVEVGRIEGVVFK